MDRKKQEDAEEAKRRRAKPRPLEWAIGGLSAVLTAALIVFFLVQALAGEAEIPDVRVEVLGVEPVGDSFHVLIEARNGGGMAAASVALRATAPGEAEASGEVTFDYIPAGSRRRGAFVFQQAPEPLGDLRIEVMGYRDP